MNAPSDKPDAVVKRERDLAIRGRIGTAAGESAAAVKRERDLAIRAALGWPVAKKGTVTPSDKRVVSPETAQGNSPASVVRDSDIADDKCSDLYFGRDNSPSTTLLAIVAFILLLVGCERQQGIVLWHAYNDAEREALEATARTWNAEHADMPLELVAVPYGAFADKITSAIPGGNGPDLFIYPQDRIGDWADSNVIEPLEFWVDDARADRFSREAIEAMAYKGSLWGMPMAVKSLALFYRTDIVAEPPRTTDELVKLGPVMRGKQGYAIAYANVDLYGHAPWLFGYGGKVMDESGKLAIATPEAANAMQFARELVQKGVTPPQAEGPLVATLFNEKRAATVISGPWFIADIKAGVPWRVTTLPIVTATGKPATPFLGAEGLLMSARARDKNAAFAVMDALTSDVAAIERAKIARQVVPNVRAYEDATVAKDDVLVAFRAQLAQTIAMPKGPAMRMVWTPYKTALGEVLSGRANASDQLRSVEREVQGYVDGAKKR